MKRKNEITDEVVMKVISNHCATIVKWVQEEIEKSAPAAIPPELASKEAEIILTKLRKAEYLDKNNQPKNLSLAEKGVLASVIAQHLGIEYLWSVFSKFWKIDKERLRQGYNTGMNQQKTMSYIGEINNILG